MRDKDFSDLRALPSAGRRGNIVVNNNASAENRCAREDMYG